MSRCKPIDQFTAQEKSVLRKRGNVYPRADNWNPYPQPVKLYDIDQNGMCWFPFALADEIECQVRNPKDFEPSEFKSEGILFTADTDPEGLGRDQNVVFKQAIEKLKKDRRVFLNLSTGFGKSALLTHIASKSKTGKAMALVFNGTIQKQLVETFKRFSNAVVQHVQGKKPLRPEAHVYVIGLKKAAMCDREFFKDVSMLIVDEVDQLPAKTLIEVMKKVNPVYLVGLTATINRDDNIVILVRVKLLLRDS